MGATSVSVGVLVVVLSACSGSPSSAPAVATGPPAVAAQGDPCRLVTAAEASALAGRTYFRGRRFRTPHGRRCVYGAGTLTAVTVEVSGRASAVAAKASFDQDVRRAEHALTWQLPAHLGATLHTSDLSGVGDRAVIATYGIRLGGETIGVSAVCVLDGAVFVVLSDVSLETTAATDQAMARQAVTGLGRL